MSPPAPCAPLVVNECALAPGTMTFWPYLRAATALYWKPTPTRTGFRITIHSDDACNDMQEIPVWPTRAFKEEHWFIVRDSGTNHVR